MEIWGQPTLTVERYPGCGRLSMATLLSLANAPQRRNECTQQLVGAGITCMPARGGHTTYDGQEGPEGTHVERPGRASGFYREDEVKGKSCIVGGSSYVLDTHSTLCHSWPHVYLDMTLRERRQLGYERGIRRLVRTGEGMKDNGRGIRGHSRLGVGTSLYHRWESQPSERHTRDGWGNNAFVVLRYCQSTGVVETCSVRGRREEERPSDTRLT